jgi:hypothetical protein
VVIFHYSASKNKGIIKMAISRFIKVAFSCLLVSGCASNIMPIFVDTPDYSKLYLRGVFTWWEADEKYKLIAVKEEKYATQIRLIADGQPYDFRFADINWSPSLNCGYVKASVDQIVTLGETVRANCESKDENFRFTPMETGLYQFSIDFSSVGSPKVKIEKLSD